MGAYKPSFEGTWATTRKWLAYGWVAVGLALSAVLFVRALPPAPLCRSRPDTKPAALTNAAVGSRHTAGASVGTSTNRTDTVYVRRFITRPIETIAVGQRVLRTNSSRAEVEACEEPSARTWRTSELEQIKPSGKRLYATLLRPPERIDQELDLASNTLELDLAELGAEGPRAGSTDWPCPPLGFRPSHIVTATFKQEPYGPALPVALATHQPRSPLGTDAFASAAATRDIGCAANHPFWSQDRQKFFSEAAEIRQGENVRTSLEEVSAFVSITPCVLSTWVYKFELQDEHLYKVGPDGVLVHNHCYGRAASGVNVLYSVVTTLVTYTGNANVAANCCSCKGSFTNALEVPRRS